jgi:hypothetical protein
MIKDSSSLFKLDRLKKSFKTFIPLENTTRIITIYEYKTYLSKSRTLTTSSIKTHFLINVPLPVLTLIIWTVHCFWVFRRYAAAHRHGLHWNRGSLWWVSVEIVSEWWNKKKSGAGHVTLFCCRALTRCCAPWSQIWFPARWSVMSVCENSEWMIE